MHKKSSTDKSFLTSWWYIKGSKLHKVKLWSTRKLL